MSFWSYREQLLVILSMTTRCMTQSTHFEASPRTILEEGQGDDPRY